MEIALIISGINYNPVFQNGLAESLQIKLVSEICLKNVRQGYYYYSIF